ncbi:hypothetical protein D9M69_473350 [compost metagenome]
MLGRHFRRGQHARRVGEAARHHQHVTFVQLRQGIGYALPGGIQRGHVRTQHAQRISHEKRQGSELAHTVDTHAPGAGEQFDGGIEVGAIHLLDHARHVGAFLAPEAGELTDAVVAAAGHQQARGLVAVEGTALGDLAAEHVLELAETAVAELLRQAREGRRIDPQLFGQLADGRHRRTLRRRDQGAEDAARAAAEGDISLAPLDGFEQEFQAR